MRLLLTWIQRCCGHDPRHNDSYASTNDKLVFEAESLKQIPHNDSKNYDDRCLDKSSDIDIQDSQPLAQTTMHKKEDEIKSTKDRIMKFVENEFPERIVKKKVRSNGKHVEDSIPTITLTGPEHDSPTIMLFEEMKKKKTQRAKGKKKDRTAKKEHNIS